MGLLSAGLLALGTAAAGIGFVKGLSNGHLFESGSNNRAAILTGLGMVALGLLLRVSAFDRAVAAVLKRFDDETPAFLARVKSALFFHARLGFWAGVAGGLVESGYRAYHTLENPWPPSLWLAPLTYGVVFAAIGLVLTIIQGGPQRASIRLALGVFLTLALSGWLIVVAPGIHPAASLILAAGIASQLSRLLMPLAHLTSVVVFQSGRVALLITLATMAGVAPSSGPLAAPGVHGAPGHNVVLLVLDTVRADELSAFGYKRPTSPNLEEWAQRGVVFESAFSTAPWTLPSHAGMFTGRWAHELDTVVPRLDGRFPTIAEVMRDSGYATSGFVANLGYTSRQTGLSRGFDHYEDQVVSVGEAVLSTALGRAVVDSPVLRNVLGYHELINRKPASKISADFLRWVDANRRRPFFAFLNYYDAHEPYMPPAADAARFRTQPSENRGAYEHHFTNIRHADWRSLSPAQVRQERDLHEAAIASIDREIGTLMSGLKARGVLDKTVVIITADHGEAFGDRGLFSHGNSLYAELVHVPLMIIVPGATGPRRVGESVSLRDLPETVLDLAGIEADSPFPGASLSRFWRSSSRPDRVEPFVFFQPATPVAAYTPLARGTMRAVIADPFHYILNGDGVEELFNYRTDPLEQHNLAGSPDAARILPGLREKLPKPVK